MRLCAEAVRHGFASVCINPVWVPRAAANLKGTGIPVASVIGFLTSEDASYVTGQSLIVDGGLTIKMRA